MGTGEMTPEAPKTKIGSQGFKNLKAWQAADDLAAVVYRLTEKDLDPRHRWLGLQLMRAAFSVTSNIAEGYGRSSLGDYARFLEMAGGLLNEVENGLHFIRRNELVDRDALTEAEQLRSTASNLLFGLLRSLRQKIKSGGDWQRGMVKEEFAEYVTDSPDDQSKFQVPSSSFLDSNEDEADAMDRMSFGSRP